jgi:hypothetical protein
VISPWRALAASPSAPGTGSSNPSPSSGESGLSPESTFAGREPRLSAWRDAADGSRSLFDRNCPKPVVRQDARTERETGFERLNYQCLRDLSPDRHSAARRREDAPAA